MQIERSKIDALQSALFEQARSLVCTAFSEADDYYGRWEPATVIVAIDSGKLIGHLAAYERLANLGCSEILLGMIGDVVVSCDRRNEGICKKLIENAHGYFLDRSIEFSLLRR